MEHKCEHYELLQQVRETWPGLVTNSSKFSDHIKQGGAWRGAIISIVVLSVTQLVSFAYMFGSLSATVRVNSEMVREVRSALYRPLPEAKHNGTSYRK